MGGIDDTFIHAPWPGSGRTLDQYELTEHYVRWREDIALIGSLGLDAVRYGLPWHRLNPEPRRWVWSWADDVMGAFAERNVEIILDVVHYGTPPWLERSFLDPAFSERMSDFTLRLLDRYPQVHWWTPFNEPRIAAWYAGRIGWWPPNTYGVRNYIAILLAICRAVVTSIHSVQRDHPEHVCLHVDPGDIYRANTPSLRREAQHRQSLVFLTLDLMAGRIDHLHPLCKWLLQHGASAATLDWFREHAIVPDVIGINLYPMFSSKELVAAGSRVRSCARYADGSLVAALSRLYWQRYQRPVMITETAARGSIERRQHWLNTLVDAVRSVRADGVPLFGCTWWPLFGLIAWAYRQGRHDLTHYVEQMGLWDLRWDARGRTCREVTPLVEAYRALSRTGSSVVGPLAAPDRVPSRRGDNRA